MHLIKTFENMDSWLKKYRWLIIPVFFLFYSAPGALEFIIYFPDEKHYGDAAIRMIETDDYLTPYKADGTPRFLKPIITYWAVIGGFKIFGINALSSRFFFWLAGALLVAIVYLMAKSLTKDRKSAYLAAIITAANPLVLVSSWRSIPDILLLLFLTVSAWGFIEIMLSNKPSKKFYWFAFMGAALAFETKGIQAVAFAGASILFLLFNPWKRKKITEIAEPFSLIASALVALFWFAAMYFEHGAHYLQSFYSDQFGERISTKILTAVINTGMAIITLAAVSLPWIIIAFSKPKDLKKLWQKARTEEKAVVAYITLWVLLTVFMSGAVFKFYDRYVLSALPLVSILFALIITRSSTRFTNGAMKTVIGLNLVFLLANLLVTLSVWQTMWYVAAVIFTAFAIWVTIRSNSHKTWRLAHAILLLFFNGIILLNALLLPNPGKQLAHAIQQESGSKNEKVYVYGSFSMAANIRIHSHNLLHVIGKNDNFSLPHEENHLLVFSNEEKQKLDLSNYNVYIAAEELSRIKPEKFPGLLEQKVRNIKSNRKIYFIAKPK